MEKKWYHIPSYMDMLDRPDSVREFRERNGVAWKVSFEKDDKHVTVQLDPLHVAIETIRLEGNRNMISEVAGYWGKEERTNEEKIIYNHALKKANEVMAVRSLGISPLGMMMMKIDTSRIRLDGFFGGKVRLSFSEEVKIEGSRKKPSKTHDVYLYANSPISPICYSPRGRSGYPLDRISDKLVLVSKI